VENAFWHALYTMRRYERNVALHMQKRGVESFVPFYSVRRHLLAGEISIEVPLFPRYAFCKCAVSALQAIRTIKGILTVVHTAGSIGTVHTQEIEAVQRLVNSGLFYEPWHHAPGKLVMIEDGPLQGIRGVLDSTGARRRLILQVSLIRRSVAVEIDDGWSLSQRAESRSM
jgi:transcription antitermination factor NusG